MRVDAIQEITKDGAGRRRKEAVSIRFLPSAAREVVFF